MVLVKFGDFKTTIIWSICSFVILVLLGFVGVFFVVVLGGGGGGGGLADSWEQFML